MNVEHYNLEKYGYLTDSYVESVSIKSLFSGFYRIKVELRCINWNEHSEKQTIEGSESETVKIIFDHVDKFQIRDRYKKMRRRDDVYISEENGKILFDFDPHYPSRELCMNPDSDFLIRCGSYKIIELKNST